jgi:hypothetical protein
MEQTTATMAISAAKSCGHGDSLGQNHILFARIPLRIRIVKRLWYNMEPVLRIEAPPHPSTLRLSEDKDSNDWVEMPF